MLERNYEWTHLITLYNLFMERVLNETELEMIYNWVDEIPLSRPKRNMARDFSDAGKTDEIQSWWLKSLPTSIPKSLNCITM